MHDLMSLHNSIVLYIFKIRQRHVINGVNNFLSFFFHSEMNKHVINI